MKRNETDDPLVVAVAVAFAVDQRSNSESASSASSLSLSAAVASIRQPGTSLHEPSRREIMSWMKNHYKIQLAFATSTTPSTTFLTWIQRPIILLFILFVTVDPTLAFSNQSTGLPSSSSSTTKSPLTTAAPAVAPSSSSLQNSKNQNNMDSSSTVADDTCSVITTTSGTTTTTFDDDDDPMIDFNQVYDHVVDQGKVYQHFDFLSEEQVQVVLQDIHRLEQTEGAFIRSGLSNTAQKQQAFGTQDRSTCLVPWWTESLQAYDEQYNNPMNQKDPCAAVSRRPMFQNEQLIENKRLRQVAHKLQRLRLALAEHLNRPTMKHFVLDKQQQQQQNNNEHVELPSPATTRLAHECYYSVSGPGSLLPRHMDERHEELKGPKGYVLPSRRSISWLVYLSDPKEWTLNENGGALRAFPQQQQQKQQESAAVAPSVVWSSQQDGNLQVGWLLPSSKTSVSQPVYLDSWYQLPQSPSKASSSSSSSYSEPHCILYTTTVPNNNNKRKEIVSSLQRIPITRPWMIDEMLQQGDKTVADFLKKHASFAASSSISSTTTTTNDHLFLDREMAARFALLEDREEWEKELPPAGSYIQDVAPLRGSLVLFDSVTLPHQVESVLQKGSKRIAIAGWFHEETQQIPTDLLFASSS